MNQNNLFHPWSVILEKIKKEKIQLIVKLNQVNENIDNRRLSELHQLVAKVILLGWKKGRPNKEEGTEFNHAA